jgi:methylase of polypeptide subunit release factors
MPDTPASPAFCTRLSAEETGGLAALQFRHPPGSFNLTPASRIAMRTIGEQQHLLAGRGLDWGSGSGCLAIAAAKIPTVNRVIGLDISPQNIMVARQNAALNGVGEKVTFLLADSYRPLADSDWRQLAAYGGRIDFILANPPSSEGDDGFGYRRIVLAGAPDFLRRGGLLFLNVSYQYGRQRVTNLARGIPGFSYDGLLASTDWVPFDLQRPDLRHCLALYVAEEERGGLQYEFRLHPGSATAADARQAWAHFQATGLSPLTRWQTHLFRYVGEDTVADTPGPA